MYYAGRCCIFWIVYSGVAFQTFLLVYSFIGMGTSFTQAESVPADRSIAVVVIVRLF